MFQINTKFMQSNIAAQEVLADTTKGSQMGSQSGPHALKCVGMNFTKTIAVIISCPFIGTMTNSGMWA